MKKLKPFKIKITETYSRDIYISAETKSEAICKAKELWESETAKCTEYDFEQVEFE